MAGLGRVSRGFLGTVDPCTGLVTEMQRPLFSRFGMAYQIGVLALLSLVVFGVISSLIIRNKYAESLRQDLAAKGESIALAISGSIQRGSSFEDLQRLSELIGQFSHIYGVTYVALRDANGDVLARTPEGPSPLPNPGIGSEREGGTQVSAMGGEGVIDVSVPVRAGNIASVHVGMSLWVVERSLEEVPVIVWRILLVSMFCAMSVALIVYLRAIRPIKLLSDSVRSIGQGNFSGQIPIRSRGEIGILARSLEQMNEDLNGYHRELETKTAELQASKEALQQQNEEIKRAQINLIRSEKLASMGQLAASVAHEISNPLAGILTYLKLIRRKLESGQGLEEHAQMFRQYLLTMEKETERCGHIVKNLLDFSRSSEPDLREVDVHRVIEDTLFLLNFKLLMSDVVVEKDFGEVPLVMGDFGQLKQVFLNVILNAVEAMKGEPRILGIHSTYHRESHTVLVEIKDSGEGIPREQIHKVFDPFFTTKPRGTGMGLAVVFGILDKHDADISIDSEPGKGTTVTIQLRAARPEPRQAAS